MAYPTPAPFPNNSSAPRPRVEMLKVSSKSNPNSVAGAMAGVVREVGAVEVQVVGAGALNQAIKAMAIARGYVAAGGIDLVCVPNFADIEIDGERRTAIRLCVGDRNDPRAIAAAAPALHIPHEARPHEARPHEARPHEARPHEARPHEAATPDSSHDQGGGRPRSGDEEQAG